MYLAGNLHHGSLLPEGPYRAIQVRVVPYRPVSRHQLITGFFHPASVGAAVTGHNKAGAYRLFVLPFIDTIRGLVPVLIQLGALSPHLRDDPDRPTGLICLMRIS